jgi:hypothetical protein
MIEIDMRLVKQLVRTQFPHWADLPVVPVEKSNVRLSPLSSMIIPGPPNRRNDSQRINGYAAAKVTLQSD